MSMCNVYVYFYGISFTHRPGETHKLDPFLGWASECNKFARNHLVKFSIFGVVIVEILVLVKANNVEQFCL